MMQPSSGTEVKAKNACRGGERNLVVACVCVHGYGCVGPWHERVHGMYSDWRQIHDKNCASGSEKLRCNTVTREKHVTLRRCL
jgi:hypothetical protein